jgi:hypothetical protein
MLQVWIFILVIYQPAVKDQIVENIPQGAKAHIDFAAIAARLNSCTFKT